MHEPTNHLETYAETRDERAFCGLVDAHLGMVFSTAMRRVGDRSLSEEISQNVFTALAKKAGQIRSSTALPAWLHRATVLECSKAIRGESRRKKRMQKLIEITVLEGEGLAAWKHASQDLDEAFDQLPDSDREILFQRFYQDLSLKEIASGQGKSVAAAQKQASRALEKLAGLMRSRGFAVPATVLASALGVEFVQAAPPNLAANISTSALASSSAGVSLLTAMSLSKFTAIGTAAGILLVVAFTGGGYLSGRSAAIAEIGKAEHPTSGNTVITALKKSTPSHADAPADDFATVRHGSLRELLLAAAEQFQRTSESEMAGENAKKLIATLRADQIAAALTEVDGLNLYEAIHQRLRWAIVGHWAGYDGPAAIAFAERNATGRSRQTGMSAALWGWGKHEPVAAYNWFRDAQSGGRLTASEQRNYLRSLMRSWAARDPQGALGELAKLGYDEQREIARSLGRLVKVEETRTPFLETLKDFPEPKLRAVMIDDAVDDWSKSDPLAAAAWFDTIEFENESLAFKPAAELAENWFEKDAGAAVDWLWGKTPEHMRAKFVEEFVRKEWAEREPEAAGRWLEDQGFERSPTEEKGK